MREIEKIKIQLENSELWSRNKYYEYIMMRFYDQINRKTTKIDREDLYYYHGKDVRAIFDIMQNYIIWITGFWEQQTIKTKF